jgi:hypothetical protein
LIRYWSTIDAEAYSIDLRGRVIADVEAGASRREAANAIGLAPVYTENLEQFPI